MKKYIVEFGLVLLVAGMLSSCGNASQVAQSVPEASPATPTPTATPILAAQFDDQRAIVFQSFRRGEEAIYMMGEDGLGQARLVSGVDPAWSPDGKRLAYSQVVENRDMIYILEPGQSSSTQLTSGFTPVWSPDGTRLAFSDVNQGNNDIFTINADGSNRQQLTQQATDELDPNWSPDGQRLIFERSGRIVILNLANEQQTVLSTGNSIDSTPAWSHDGNWIAFSSRFKDTNGNGQIDYNDNSQIMLLNMGDQKLTALTNFPENTGNPIWAQSPAWSPEDKTIAFESNRDGQWDIWVINRDGSLVKNLTGDESNSVNLNPRWFPVIP